MFKENYFIISVYDRVVKVEDLSSSVLLYAQVRTLLGTQKSLSIFCVLNKT